MRLNFEQIFLEKEQQNWFVYDLVAKWVNQTVSSYASYPSYWRVVIGRVLKNNVIGRVLLTWSMQRSTPGSELPGLQRQKDDLSPAFLHCVGTALHTAQGRIGCISNRGRVVARGATQCGSWLAVKPC